MYPWQKTETIEAWKLNCMQVRPLMETINKGGVSGGLDGSSLSMETIGGDIGSAGTPPEPIHTQEHDLGYWRMDYDTSTEQWRLKSGNAGVTGVVTKDAGSQTWITKCTTQDEVNWHHITTDRWGNVVTSEQTMDTCAHTTRMWEPSADDGTGTGDIWRRMGSIYKDERFANVKPSERSQWIYTATNENNALMMPVARHVGWECESSINICSAQDVRDRKGNSVWVRTAMPDKGASVPIRSIGELGGTFVYRTIDGGSQEVGIGIASGVEFYDSCTINNRNICGTRPMSTTARVDFGSCGKHGYIQLQNINPLHPWQFMLTGHLDIGSGGGGCSDPGTGWWHHQVDCHKLPYANVQWTDAQGLELYFPYPLTDRDCSYIPTKPQDGIISARSLRRVMPQVTAQEKWGERVHGHRAGSIFEGEIYIGTAYQQWVCKNQREYKQQANCKSEWNPNGGLISGIEISANGWPEIDLEGTIKLPTPEYMGNHFVAPAYWIPTQSGGTQRGVISCIHNQYPAKWHYIAQEGDIKLAGAHYKQPGYTDEGGVIQSVSMICSTCQPRICDGKIYIPQGGEQEICMANYYPQICTVPGLIQSARWHDDITYIDHGDLKLGTAHWSNELGGHMCDRTGGIKAVCLIGAGKGSYACIQNGSIIIDLGSFSGGGGGCVPTANYNPLYPQFKRTGTVNQIEWSDCTTQIAQGDVRLSTAYFDPGTAGASWTQVQRTGGIAGLCWGTRDNKAMIDNGWIYAPTAVYYPCNTGPVPNRPGLIRGVKAVDYLLPAPFIDECGYLHIRA